MAPPASLPPADQVDWFVEIEEPLPDVKSCKDAWNMLASPSTWKDWRSSDFAKFGVILGDTKEPVKTNDEYHMKVLCMKPTMYVVESESHSDESTEHLVDTYSSMLFGLIQVRLKFSVYKKDDGIIYGKAQEKAIKGQWMFPKKEVTIGEHKTMFQELNDTLKAST